MDSFFILLFVLLFSTSVFAKTTVVKLFSVDDASKGEARGIITIEETKYGLLFVPELTGLRGGMHGFHIHQFSSCDKNGMAAGGHFDPQNTGKHLGPYNDRGHLGDLPILMASDNGEAIVPVLAPRLTTISQIQGHALMIHEGGDTYSDLPTLGGGGDRMECGIIQ